jgi:hypothetical protein
VHLIGLFRKALNEPLARRILFGEEIPKTIEGWFKKANQFDSNFRMAQAIMGKKTTNGKKPWQTSKPAAKDPNAMDVDALSTEQKNEYMQKGLCFKCGERGHLSRNCKGKGKEAPKQEEKKKWTPSDIKTHIKGLSTADREELMKLMVADGNTDF